MRFVFDYRDVSVTGTASSLGVQSVTDSDAAPPAPATILNAPTEQRDAVGSSLSNIKVSSSGAGPMTLNGRKRHPNGSSSRRTPTKETMRLAAGEKMPRNVSSKGDAKTKHPGGRPTKRTPEITARIAEAISFGLTDDEAAAVVGIDDDTLTQWRKIPEFSGAIKTAVATRKLARLKRIEAGELGWQGTAWAMERQYPERFARPEIQLNLDCASRESQKREQMQLFLEQVRPTIQQIVESQPEEENWGSAPTGIAHRPLPSLGDVDFD